MNSVGVLYVVATPIGNLADITPRAVQILAQVDYIACEDTRTSAKLLQHFAIATKTIAYHDHNADSATEKIIQLLLAGKNIALISDAGTPLISDPGYRLTRACHENHIQVSPVVGACAAIAALSVAGLPSDRFYFYGFLPTKTKARKDALAELGAMPCSVIVYEAPHRIVETLTDICAVLGGMRNIALCRELTKTFETVRLLPAEQMLAWVKQDENQQKGEMVLIIEKAEHKAQADAHDALLLALADELSIKSAAHIASAITGVKKNTLYDRLLFLKQNT